MARQVLSRASVIGREEDSRLSRGRRVRLVAERLRLIGFGMAALQKLLTEGALAEILGSRNCYHDSGGWYQFVIKSKKKL